MLSIIILIILAAFVYYVERRLKGINSRVNGIANNAADLKGRVLSCETSVQELCGDYNRRQERYAKMQRAKARKKQNVD